MADRVLVIRDGAIVRILDRSAGDDLSEEALSRAVQEQEVSRPAADRSIDRMPQSQTTRR